MDIWKLLRRSMQEERRHLTEQELDSLADYVLCESFSQSDLKDIAEVLVAEATSLESGELEPLLHVTHAAAVRIATQPPPNCTEHLRQLLTRVHGQELEYVLSLLGMCGTVADLGVIGEFTKNPDSGVRAEAQNAEKEILFRADPQGTKFGSSEPDRRG